MSQPSSSNQGDDRVEGDSDSFDDDNDPPHVYEFKAALDWWMLPTGLAKVATVLTPVAATLGAVVAVLDPRGLSVKETVLIWLFVVPVVILAFHVILLPWNAMAYRRFVRRTHELRAASPEMFDRIAGPALADIRGLSRLYMHLYRWFDLGIASK